MRLYCFARAAARGVLRCARTQVCEQRRTTPLRESRERERERGAIAIPHRNPGRMVLRASCVGALDPPLGACQALRVPARADAQRRARRASSQYFARSSKRGSRRAQTRGGEHARPSGAAQRKVHQRPARGAAKRRARTAVRDGTKRGDTKHEEHANGLLLRLRVLEPSPEAWLARPSQGRALLARARPRHER